MEEIRRTTDDPRFEIRAAKRKNGKPILMGYAAVFNSLSKDLGGFIETIKPGAFTDVLKSPDLDVSCRVQHEGGLTTIARTTNGSLKLHEDDFGLFYEATVPNTQAGRDIVQLVRDGLITKSSFSFTVEEAGVSWDFSKTPPLRTIMRVLELLDVSPVDGPAYEATTVEVRKAGAATFETMKLQIEGLGEVRRLRREIDDRLAQYRLDDIASNAEPDAGLGEARRMGEEIDRMLDEARFDTLMNDHEGIALEADAIGDALASEPVTPISTEGLTVKELRAELSRRFDAVKVEDYEHARMLRNETDEQKKAMEWRRKYDAARPTRKTFNGKWERMPFHLWAREQTRIADEAADKRIDDYLKEAEANRWN